MQLDSTRNPKTAVILHAFFVYAPYIDAGNVIMHETTLCVRVRHSRM